ncbi:MAG: CDP-alcohol phosphatidyltransferase family protein [Gemmatimonadota bacterium]|nr:CDP-alcohol phosphatidyltransferase family protein [Gemmatimonadota bacterium]
MSTEPVSTSYRFTDRSLLRPWLTRVWFERLFPLLPRWLAANIVTVLSTGVLLSVLLASFVADQIGAAGYALLQLVALQLYVAGDHLDGMQAKASGTTSPLGDFLDHHCDLWAGCVLCFGFWSLTGGPLWELFVLTGLMILGFAITYVERAERRALHFTSWGTLEAIAIVTAFYLAWCFGPVRAWFQQTTAGIPRHMFVAAIGVVMCVGVIVVIARRLARLPVPLLLFASMLIALAVWIVRHPALPPLAGWLLVGLAGAEYVARVMQAHTTTRPRPWPDALAVLGTAALWLRYPVADAPVPILIAFGGWLTLRYLVTLTRIIAGWRMHWVWVNATPGDSAKG